MENFDNTFESWPQELLHHYGQLKLPSLYDFVLANEKLSAEIRRQSKELHKLQQRFTEMRQQFNALDNRIQVIDIENEEPEDDLSSNDLSNADEEDPDDDNDYYPAWEVDMMRQGHEIEQRQWEDIYVSTLEIVFHFVSQSHKLTKNILNFLPSDPIQGLNLHQGIDLISKDHLSSLENIKEQLMAHLLDLKIELIAPEIGDSYNQNLHRIVDKKPSWETSGSKPNTIASLIRMGYYRQGVIVRQADVSIYL